MSARSGPEQAPEMAGRAAVNSRRPMDMPTRVAEHHNKYQAHGLERLAVAVAMRRVERPDVPALHALAEQLLAESPAPA
jgi:hypothetical protein